MKKKLVMRIASLALCVVFVGMLFGAPKAEAVAVEATAVTIGVAVLGSYVAATQLRFTADVADTISSGIMSLVSDWVEASAVAASADDWLANLGNATQMTSPGMLQLQGAFARGCAQFVEWLTETYGLVSDGIESIIQKGTADRYLFGLVNLPALPVYNTQVYPYAVLYSGTNSGTTTYYLYVSNSKPYYVSSTQLRFENYCSWTCSSGNDWGGFSSSLSGTSASVGSNSKWTREVLWANFPLSNLAGVSVYQDPVAVGNVSGQLSIAREEGFANSAFDAADDDDLKIFTGLTAPTLSDFALEVPSQIVAGEFAPTVELTQEGEGAGEEVEMPDDATVVPGVTPWLQSIFNAIKGIADRIVSGIKGLFVPDQTAVDSFSDEVDAKLPFIGTLQGFGGDLAYKLEHPEECANGLGLTTVVDLGKGRGSYLGTTKHDLLDVSWYLEYKPMVDDIIVGFCWLCFLWNCYGALPRIIHGEGSIAGVISILRKEDGES